MILKAYEKDVENDFKSQKFKMVASYLADKVIAYEFNNHRQE